MYKSIIFLGAILTAISTQASTPGMSFRDATDIKQELDTYVDTRYDADATTNRDSSGQENRTVSYPVDEETKARLDEQNNSIPYFGEGAIINNKGYSHKIQFTQTWGDENFSSTIDMAYAVDGTKDVLSSSSWFKGTAVIKDTPFNLIEFNQTSINDAPSQMFLAVLGTKVWSKSGYIIRESPSFTRKVEQTYDYTFGPLSFAVNANVGGVVGAEISADTMRGAKLINALVRPNTNIYATASVEASAYFVSADVTGQLQVLNSSLPAKTYLQWLPGDNKLIVGYYVNGEVNTMTGDLSAHAYIDLAPWYSDSWTWPLYSSHGYHQTWDIANDQYVIPL